MRRSVSLVGCAVLLAAGALGAAASASGCGSFSSEEGAPVIDAAPEGASPGETGAPADAGEAGRDAASPRTLSAVFARGFGEATDAGADAAGGVGLVLPGGMAVDPSGGVAIVGSYYGAAADVAGVRFPVPVGVDAFIVRLDGTGARVASRVFSQSNDVFGQSIAGSDTLLYASFGVSGQLAFTGSDVFYSAALPGHLDSTVPRFNGALVVSGHTDFGGNFDVLAKHTAIGTGGSLVTFGDWETAIQADGQTSVSRGPGTGLFFTRTFPAAGADVVSTTYCDSPNQCVAGALATNAVGEALAGGRFTGQLGAPSDAGVSTTAADEDAYLVKLDAQLVVQWVVSFGGAGTQEVLAIAPIPGTGDFVAAGTFDATFTIPGTPVVATRGLKDVFVVRVDASGHVVWAKTVGGPGADLVHAITVDASGNVFLAGSFSGPTIDLGGGSLANADVKGTGTTDVFVAWLEGDGSYVYSTRFGDGADDDAVGVGVDALSHVLVTGTFGGAIDFGSGPLQAQGKTDMFVAKLGYVPR